MSNVFFVLSGYLVTHLLVRDLEGSGSIGFGRFYSRRARRLLPAALTVLVVTSVVYTAVASPAEAADSVRSVQASALYVVNWYFVGQASDYFASPVEASPVVNFWSLAVEEQFYILWPLLLAGLRRLSRRAGGHRRRVLQAMVAAAAASSLGAALALQSGALARAYYGTDTRAYQLLAGALLALAPGAVARLGGRARVRRLLPVVSAAAFIGLVAAATWALDVGPITRGAIATALTVTLLASLEASTSGPVRWALSLPPMVYLGRISYGTYLWHWLVIVVLLREHDAGSLGTAAITMAVATGLASLSYQLLEMPIRRATVFDRPRIAVIAAGLALSLLVGLFVVPRALEADPSSEVAVATPGRDVSVGASTAGVDWDAAGRDTMDFPPCPATDPSRCTLVEGSGEHVMLVGDSVALTLVPMFEDLARDHDLTFSAALTRGCPWLRDVFQYGMRSRCMASKPGWYDRIVPALDPDVVVLAHRAISDPPTRRRSSTSTTACSTRGRPRSPVPSRTVPAL